ncbi:MAG: hypothetical protein KAI94_03190 [Anaerolineales bacterium]|nr:hypothetical protein [Anaerolineales bacterium]
MDNKTLKSVVTQIHHRFPEVNGCQPKVRSRKSAQPKSTSAKPTYLLTFHGKGKAVTSNGKKTIPRYVRVVVNEKGKILKITTSR